MGRNLHQNQAQGNGDICHDRLRGGKHVLFLLFYFSELIEDSVFFSFTNICSLKMIEDDN